MALYACKEFDYWKKLFEKAKTRKTENLNCLESILQKYYPEIGTYDEDDLITESLSIEDKEWFEDTLDTVSWKWINVSGEETKQNITINKKQNIVKLYQPSSSSCILEMSFHQTDFFFE